uniref:Uncharacterized protein n=1 Tax=Panagrolaimus superbus TaxID=310955 RepID=A0A914Y9T2_9BILA
MEDLYVEQDTGEYCYPYVFDREHIQVVRLTFYEKMIVSIASDGEEAHIPYHHFSNFIVDSCAGQNISVKFDGESCNMFAVNFHAFRWFLSYNRQIVMEGRWTTEMLTMFCTMCGNKTESLTFKNYEFIDNTTCATLAAVPLPLSLNILSLDLRKTSKEKLNVIVDALFNRYEERHCFKIIDIACNFWPENDKEIGDIVDMQDAEGYEFVYPFTMEPRFNSINELLFNHGEFHAVTNTGQRCRYNVIYLNTFLNRLHADECLKITINNVDIVKYRLESHSMYLFLLRTKELTLEGDITSTIMTYVLCSIHKLRSLDLRKCFGLKSAINRVAARYGGRNQFETLYLAVSSCCDIVEWSPIFDIIWGLTTERGSVTILIEDNNPGKIRSQVLLPFEFQYRGVCLDGTARNRDRYGIFEGVIMDTHYRFLLKFYREM